MCTPKLVRLLLSDWVELRLYAKDRGVGVYRLSVYQIVLINIQ